MEIPVHEHDLRDWLVLSEAVIDMDDNVAPWIRAYAVKVLVHQEFMTETMLPGTTRADTVLAV